jgi:NAD-dependent SIR2 family protein deacetylase
MAKFTSADVSGVAERLKQARRRKHPAHFLIGAGASISAGIPSAADLVEKIHSDYQAQCTARLTDDNRLSYGACMQLLSINERRDLIRPFLEVTKINWGTIALAQLMRENYVERVLTVNFDLVLERACGLLGLQPAVYDFGVAPANDPSMIVSQAIVHLHGQSYGLVLLNTDDETKEHRKKLQPILKDTLRTAPLVVLG